MSFRLSSSARNAAANAIADALNGGYIQIRTGAQPTNVADAAQGTLLGTCTFSPIAFGSPSSGVKTASAISSDLSADASGTAAHARLLDSSAVIHSDCSCGQGSGDISFDNNVIVSTGVIAISSLTITVPI